jgi:hypothetical protein
MNKIKLNQIVCSGGFVILLTALTGCPQPGPYSEERILDNAVCGFSTPSSLATSEYFNEFLNHKTGGKAWITHVDTTDKLIPGQKYRLRIHALTKGGIQTDTRENRLELPKPKVTAIKFFDSDNCGGAAVYSRGLFSEDEVRDRFIPSDDDPNTNACGTPLIRNPNANYPSVAMQNSARYHDSSSNSGSFTFRDKGQFVLSAQLRMQNSLEEDLGWSQCVIVESKCNSNGENCHVELRTPGATQCKSNPDQAGCCLPRTSNDLRLHYQNRCYLTQFDVDRRLTE